MTFEPVFDLESGFSIVTFTKFTSTPTASVGIRSVLISDVQSNHVSKPKITKCFKIQTKQNSNLNIQYIVFLSFSLFYLSLATSARKSVREGGVKSVLYFFITATQVAVLS